MKTRGITRLVLTFLALQVSCGTETGEWIPLFDGSTLEGWKASENPDSFRVEDGAIVCNGPRAHLFYVGESGEARFENFEFTAEVKTTPGSNSGIYFHTQFQPSGWPSKGYESQVLNSNLPVGADGYVERKMTGSLYAIRNVWKPMVPDNQWFEYRIVVEGKTVRIRIDGELVVDYTESDNPPRPADMQERLLGSGTFALQCHDPESTVYYRNLRVKPLPPGLPTPGQPNSDPDLEQQLIDLGGRNFPLMDLHVHLKQGLTLEQALARSREYGITYGIAVNCGLGMTIPDQETMDRWLTEYRKPPQTYVAMQAEGREWLDLFSRDSMRRFDYVFSDSMTWTNDDGKRMRLWIEDEVEIGDPQEFMEMLVDRTEGILRNEPIDIYVNPTYLPEAIKERYDELWTPARMDRVIRALVESGVAMEINDARRIPSPAFIQRAKDAGVKFTFGTNNAGSADLGHLQYALEMIQECKLEPTDIWVPGEKLE